MADKNKMKQAVKTLQKSFDEVMGSWLKKQSAWLEMEGFTPAEMIEIMKQSTGRR